MTFIETRPLQDADGEVLELYQRYQTALGYVPNYAKVFSLRPAVNAAWNSLLGSIRGGVPPRNWTVND